MKMRSGMLRYVNYHGPRLASPTHPVDLASRLPVHPQLGRYSTVASNEAKPDNCRGCGGLLAAATTPSFREC